MKKFNLSTLFVLITLSFCCLMSGCGSSGGADSGGTTATPDVPDVPTQPTYNFTGTVYDENGSALSGLSVSVFSNPKTISTGTDGKFSFSDVTTNVQHTLLVSGDGYTETYKVVKIPKGGTWNQPVMLKDSPVPTSNVLAKSGKLLFSNPVKGQTAKLDIPAQASSTFDAGSKTGLSNTDISLEYIDISMPLPVPLPSPETLDAKDVLIGGKQAPSVMVAVRPALLKLKTAATLYLPNPDDLTGIRILRFDPYESRWVNTNHVTDDSPADGTTLSVTDGGVYGIFYEESKLATVKGTAVPGSLVFVGDEVVRVSTSGTFYVNEVPVPPDGEADMYGLEPDTSVVSVLHDQDLRKGETLTVNFSFTAQPDSFTIVTSQSSVKSDNSDSALITVTAMDKSHVAVKGVNVTFFANGGLLSASSVETDENGKAEVTFSAGTIDQANKVVTITASVSGFSSKTTSVLITGTEIKLSSDKTELGTGILTITVLNAGEQPIQKEEIIVRSVDPNTLNDNDRIITEPDEGYEDSFIGGNRYLTDVSGILRLKVSGSTIGSAMLRVESMGAVATQNYKVVSTGKAFAISKIFLAGQEIEASDDLISLNTGQIVRLTVNAPGREWISFSTPVGNWAEKEDGEYNSKLIDIAVAGGVASAWFKSDKVGLATVQVFDKNDPVTSDILNIAVSAPPDEAETIILQSGSAVVPVSTPDVVNSTTLRAIVKNAEGQVVGGAPVAFSIEENTGGGESVSKPIVYTDNSGVAECVFTSGTLGSDSEGVRIIASLVRDMSKTDDVRIIISGVPASVQITPGTTIRSVVGDTAYEIPMSVIVADANSNPVSGVTVSLSAWPYQYSTGWWVGCDDTPPCCLYREEAFPNEDINRNLVMDENEDLDNSGGLTPRNSAAGTLQSSVVTDENGIGEFTLTYPKASAAWIKDEITATTFVSGTENRLSYRFWLPYLGDEKCSLPHSPYIREQIVNIVVLSAEPPEIVADGSSRSVISAVVTDVQGNKVDDMDMVFRATTGDIDPDTPGIQGTFTTTIEDGRAHATLVSLSFPGSSVVTGVVQNITETVTVTFVPGEPAKISLSANPDNITADGISTSEIRATVTDIAGNHVADGENVNFSITAGGGTLSSQKGAVADGVVTVTYTSPTDKGIATVEATCRDVSETVTINLIEAKVGGLELEAGSRTIVADGTSSTTIRADVTDTNGNPVKDGTLVTFKTTAGYIGSTAQCVNGLATATLRSSDKVGTATVTATSGGVNNTVTVEFVPGKVKTITLKPEPGTLTADGTSTSEILATVRDAKGNAVNNEVISFSIVKQDIGSGKLSASKANTEDGLASVTFTPSADTEGEVHIKAESTNKTSATVIVYVTPTGVAAMLSLVASQPIVKSDDSDHAVITATVQDSNHAAMEGVTVSFKADGGHLSAANVDTDENGKAEVRFSSGSVDRANKEVTITATITGNRSESVPVRITGTKIILSADRTNVGTGTLTIDVKDAGMKEIYNADVKISCLDLTGSFESDMLTWVLHQDYDKYSTDVEGRLMINVFGGTKKGKTVLRVESMGTHADQEYVVTSTGELFQVSKIVRNGTEISATDNVTLYTDQELEITVQAAGRNKVRFATIFGKWENNNKYIDVDVTSEGTATATLSSAEAGSAIVQISDAEDPSTSLSFEVIITAPVSQAKNITLQADPTVLAPSDDETKNTSVLTVTVRNSAGQVVGGAPVSFAIVGNTIAGGEKIDPPIAYTDSSGTAISTFYAGSIGSGAEGIAVKASVVNADPPVESKKVNIIIGKTATSVHITRSLVGQSTYDDTSYTIPMSVIVTDARGNAVPNAKVYLGIWPTHYAVGYKTADRGFIGWVEYPNEDKNKNEFWDPGETDYNGDDLLTPRHSAAGSLPESVTTDENGIGSFELNYLKNSAIWVKVEVTATTRVSGSETRSTLSFRLPALVVDWDYLPHSPFNAGTMAFQITLKATPETLPADGKSKSVIRAEVTDADGNFVEDGTPIVFESSAGVVFPEDTVTKNGVATATFTSPDYVGTATVTARVKDVENVTGTTQITLEPGKPDPIHTKVTARPYSNLTADGNSTTTIEAVVFDEKGNIVADGENIIFDLQGDKGSLSSRTAETADGVASVTYTSPRNTTGSETVIVKRIDGTELGSVRLTLIKAIVGNVEIASLQDILADGKSSIRVRATVTDINGNTVADGTLVSFMTTAGKIFAPGTETVVDTAVTANGIAIVDLVSSSNVGTAVITASSGGVSGTANVSFIPGPVSKITLTASPDTLDADGTSTSQIRAEVTDAYGNAIDNEVISFMIIGQSNGTLSAPTARTSGGVATVTYTSSLVPGKVVIGAKATNGVNALSVEIAAAPTEIGSLEISADKTEIMVSIDSVPQEAVITATLKDSTGATIADAPVLFRNITTLGDTDPWPEDDTVQGKGRGKTPLFFTRGGNFTFTMTNTASRFEVWLWNDKTNDNTLVLNTVNAVTDEVRSMYLEAGTYFLDVDTSDNWIIKVDGDASAVSEDLGEIICSEITNAEGNATCTYESTQIAEVVTIKAESGETSAEINITQIPGPPYQMEISADPDSIYANAYKTSLITATVRDINNNMIRDVDDDGKDRVVSFSVSGDGDLEQTETEITGGVAMVKLTAPSNEADTDGTVRAEILVTGNEMVSNFVKVNFLGVSLADMAASPANIEADGKETSEITIRLRNANGGPIVGEPVLFTTTGGTIRSQEGGLTDENGLATAVLTSSIAPGTATVTARYGQSKNSPVKQIGITFDEPETPPISDIALSADPETLPADGKSQSIITARITQVGGDVVPDETPVEFEIVVESEGEDVGKIAGGTSTTAYTVNGVAIATLTAGEVAKEITIVARAGGKTSELKFNYTPGSISLIVVPNALLATGEETTTVRATLKYANEEPAPPGEIVKFEIDDPSLGSITPEAESDSSGVARAQFQAGSKGGTVTVTATWSPGGIAITGTETIDIHLPPASIREAEGSPDPTSISVKATGGISTSLITFEVVDSKSVLVADGYRIDFEILDGPDGGETISPIFALTSDGKISTVLRSGFKSGPVSIKAIYYHNSNVSIISSQIAIVAGPPVGSGFGVAPAYKNVSGLATFEMADIVTVNASDFYGNSIPDETAISFKTYNTGGQFDPGSAPTVDGFAKNNLFTTESPRPNEGFLSVTTEAINGGRTTNVSALEVVQSTPDTQIIYAGTDGGGVYKSLDSGATWANISRSSNLAGQNWINPYVNDIAVDPDNPNRVYAATGVRGEGSVYRSLDGGLNWNSNNMEEWYGIFSSPAAVLTVLCDDDGRDTPSGDENKCYYNRRYYDTETFYYKCELQDSEPLPGVCEERLSSNEVPCYRHVWIGTDGYGAYYSTDGDYFSQSEGLAGGTVVNDIIKAGGSMHNARLYAATAAGIFKSTDGGRSWDPTTSFLGYHATTLALYPGAMGDDVIYAGTKDAGVWVSNNSGESWLSYRSGIGKGLSATVPVALKTNRGVGVMSEVKVFDDCMSENWSLVFQDATENNGAYFTVEGTVSKEQANYYFAGTATVPQENMISENKGQMSKVLVSPHAGDTLYTENWTVTCIQEAANGGIFKVEGSISGQQPNYDITATGYEIRNLLEFTISDGTVDFEVGDAFEFRTIKPEDKYEIPNVLEFTISDVVRPFETGDIFTFSTTRDEGDEIKDLFVDPYNGPEGGYLYAITYYNSQGRQEPHPVGNLYVHELEKDGSMSPGSWKEANTDLPMYDAPDDITLFGQHVIAANNPDMPTALFIGGEGISLLKATEGVDIGTPKWVESKSGMTNLIMARTPVLFSGSCTMTTRLVRVVRPDTDLYDDIEEPDVIYDYKTPGFNNNFPLLRGDVVTFHVYVQDINGNPPIEKSTISGRHQFTRPVTFYSKTYSDVLTDEGTFRDPENPVTNRPIVIDNIEVDVVTMTITFTPTCQEASPGCSGGVQSDSYN